MQWKPKFGDMPIGGTRCHRAPVRVWVHVNQCWQVAVPHWAQLCLPVCSWGGSCWCLRLSVGELFYTYLVLPNRSETNPQSVLLILPFQPVCSRLLISECFKKKDWGWRWALHPSCCRPGYSSALQNGLDTDLTYNRQAFFWVFPLSCPQFLEGELIPEDLKVFRMSWFQLLCLSFHLNPVPPFNGHWVLSIEIFWIQLEMSCRPYQYSM